MPRPRRATEALDYVGSEVCATCHPAHGRAHAASRHANTVRTAQSPTLASAFGSRQQVIDRDYGFVYSVSEANGRRLIQLIDGDRRHEAEARFAFGSGKHGWTFICERGGTLLEARISYYRRTRRWDLTPGQTRGPVPQSPLGKPQSVGEVNSCFLCHSTVAVVNGERIDVAASRLNVGCEACHGPGRAHVELSQQNPAQHRPPATRLSGPQVIQLCGGCHRTLPPQGRRPTMASADQVVRFQGIGIAMSRCYTESGGRLSCLTCHDPHQNAERNPEHYTRACLGCHSGGRQGERACPVKPNAACVSCHMPPRPVGFPQGMRFYDHWIRVRPAAPARVAR